MTQAITRLAPSVPGTVTAVDALQFLADLTALQAQAPAAVPPTTAAAVVAAAGAAAAAGDVDGLGVGANYTYTDSEIDLGFHSVAVDHANNPGAVLVNATLPPSWLSVGLEPSLRTGCRRE